MRNPVETIRMKLASGIACMRAWAGHSDGAPDKNSVEFREVFDEVLEEGDWIGLSAGALERSWRSPRAKV